MFYRNTNQTQTDQVVTLPKITVITPSYNQGIFLERTIKSILNQNYPNLEYLIFDGGSQDNSLDIIKKYKKHITLWESKKDRGQSHAVNKGLRYSKGEIIGWLNSDDTYLPRTFEKVVRAFKIHPEVDAIYGNYVYVDPFDYPILYRRLFRKFSYTTLLFHDYIGQPALFFKRNLIAKIGYLDESLQFAMDWDFFLRMKRTAKMLYVNEYLATFRIHPESKSSEDGNSIYKKNIQSIHHNNAVPIFRHKLLNTVCMKILKYYSLVQRLYTVIRDNPYCYFRFYKKITGRHPLRGLLWRIKMF